MKLFRFLIFIVCIAVPLSAMEQREASNIYIGRELAALDCLLPRAIQANDLVMVRQLLEAGANANPQDPEDACLLSRVLSSSGDRNDTEILRLLLDYGAPLDRADNELGYPLLYVGAGSLVNNLEMLIREGASIVATGYDDEAVIHGAARWGNKEFLRVLVAGYQVDVNTRDRRLRTPLWFAVSGGHYNAASYLLRSGANANLYGDGKLPLQIALENQDTRMVKLLVEHGAAIRIQGSFSVFSGAYFTMDPDIRNFLEMYDRQLGELLLSAIRHNNQNNLVALLNRGADPNYDTDNRGPSPYGNVLHVAAEYGRSNLIPVLVGYGARIDETDGVFGDAPLHCAIRNRQEVVAYYLISLGAPLDQRNYDGLTPLELAQLAYPAIVPVVQNAMGLRNAVPALPGASTSIVQPLVVEPTQELHRAACDGDIGVVCEQMNLAENDTQRIALWRQCDEHGHVPAFYAARRNHTEIVRIALRMAAQAADDTCCICYEKITDSAQYAVGSPSYDCLHFICKQCQERSYAGYEYQVTIHDEDDQETNISQHVPSTRCRKCPLCCKP